MSAPLLRSFDRLDDATAARNELVAAGFSPAAVQVRAMEDEAGPVQGNFTVGNGRTDIKPGDSDFVTPASPDPYALNFAHPTFRGGNLLVVQAADEAQRQQAMAIVDRFGGVDPDRVNAAGTASRGEQP